MVLYSFLPVSKNRKCDVTIARCLPVSSFLNPNLSSALHLRSLWYFNIKHPRELYIEEKTKIIDLKLTKSHILPSFQALLSLPYIFLPFNSCKKLYTCSLYCILNICKKSKAKENQFVLENSIISLGGGVLLARRTLYIDT